MEKSSIISWIFASVLYTVPAAIVGQSPTALSSSVTTDAVTELNASILNKEKNRAKRRKIRIKSRRIEQSDAALAKMPSVIQQNASIINTPDVDLHALLHATSGRTIKSMKKWL